MFTNLLQVGISTCNFPVFFLNILFIINNLCFATSTDADCYLLFPLLFSWLLVFPQRKNRFPCVEGGFSVPALKLNGVFAERMAALPLLSRRHFSGGITPSNT